LAAVVSYLGYHDIDIVPAKFKKKVTVPKLRREDEQAIDVGDIRQMLLKCENRRLKTYLLVLASGGLRAVEGLAIRIKDIDFTVSPTKIHVRGEYAKTRVARDIYISDEATQALKARISWKYRGDRPKAKDDLVWEVVLIRARYILPLHMSFPRTWSWQDLRRERRIAFDIQ